MWTLVLIWLFNGEPEVRKIATYDDMFDCFSNYDMLYYSMTPESRVGVRLTCIQGDTNAKDSNNR